jgi:hypothetical protein
MMTKRCCSLEVRGVVPPQQQQQQQQQFLAWPS